MPFTPSLHLGQVLTNKGLADTSKVFQLERMDGLLQGKRRL